jgi:hypothetical protein
MYLIYLNEWITGIGYILFGRFIFPGLGVALIKISSFK